jgi:hypothetical protein
MRGNGMVHLCAREEGYVKASHADKIRSRVRCTYVRCVTDRRASSPRDAADKSWSAA